MGLGSLGPGQTKLMLPVEVYADAVEWYLRRPCDAGIESVPSKPLDAPVNPGVREATCAAGRG